MSGDVKGRQYIGGASGVCVGRAGVAEPLEEWGNFRGKRRVKWLFSGLQRPVTEGGGPFVRWQFQSRRKRVVWRGFLPGLHVSATPSGGRAVRPLVGGSS